MIFMCAFAGKPLLGESKKIPGPFTEGIKRTCSIHNYCWNSEIVQQHHRFNLIPFLSRTWCTFYVWLCKFVGEHKLSFWVSGSWALSLSLSLVPTMQWHHLKGGEEGKEASMRLKTCLVSHMVQVQFSSRERFSDYQHRASRAAIRWQATKQTASA